MTSLNLDFLTPLQAELEAHPIQSALRELEDLRVFMAHHVFAVWDFMSLIKYLQQRIAPTDLPWQPLGDPQVRYFINQLVQEEESDHFEINGAPVYGSHFDIYCQAMQEVGADAQAPWRFVADVKAHGLDRALYAEAVPLPARYFTETTYCFIREDKPHVVAAALALGRERLIPEMFRRFLAGMGITATQAPGFHAYLHRHIHLDADFHGPLSLQLLNALCDGETEKLNEAQIAAEEAVCARLRFWDGIVEAIAARRG